MGGEYVVIPPPPIGGTQLTDWNNAFEELDLVVTSDAPAYSTAGALSHIATANAIMAKSGIEY